MLSQQNIDGYILRGVAVGRNGRPEVIYGIGDGRVSGKKLDAAIYTVEQSAIAAAKKMNNDCKGRINFVITPVSVTIGQ